MKHKRRQIDHKIAFCGPIFDSGLNIFWGGEAHLTWAAIEIPLFYQRRRVHAGTVYISCLFSSKPKKGVGIQNYRFSIIAGH